MKHTIPPISVSKQSVEDAAMPWLNRLARWGFGAKGVVYLIVGILALQTALGRGGATTDSHGALQTIAGQPYGAALLLIVAVGLAGYALWRFVQAWAEPAGQHSSVSSLARRAGCVVSGIAYLALAFTAVQIVQGRHAANSGSQTEQNWTARILHEPLGRWAVALVGVGILIVYLYQLFRASQGDVPEKLHVGSMGGVDARWLRRLGGFGLAAQGVVFGLTGLFLIQASLTYDPQRAGGLDQALQTLARQGYGQVLLGIVSLGLIAYACYLLLLAWSIRSPMQ